MAKSKLPYIFGAIGLAAGIAAYFYYYDRVNEPAPAVQTGDSSTASESAEQEVAAVDPEAGEGNETAAAAAAGTLPAFTILRVEPDGSAVIGGTAPAASEVELFDGDKSLGKTSAGPSGDFVIVLDEPLGKGLHELSLSATKEDGEKIVSTETGVVNVPEPDQPEELTVIVTAPEEPTRVIAQAGDDQAGEAEPQEQEVAQAETSGNSESTGTEQSQETAQSDTDTASGEDNGQQTEEAASEEAAGQETASAGQEAESAQEEEPAQEVASAGTETSGDASQENAEQDTGTEINSGVANLEVNTETDNVAVSAKKEEADGSPAAPSRPVLIEAADIEGGKIFIAGSGEPGANVSIYLGEEFLGRTTVSENGSFLFEGRKELGEGTYAIRADMTDGNQSDVVARAQVKLLHDPVEDGAEETVIASAEEPASSQSGSSSTGEGDTGASSGSTQETASSSAASTDSSSGTSAETETGASSGTETAAVAETAGGNESGQEAVIRTGSAVIIRKGDNLWTIARRNYGAGIRYTTIFEANRDQIQDPDLIFPGQVFKVPEDGQ